MTDDGFRVLLVEDNKHDVRFVQRAWKVNGLTNPLHVVTHGEACLEFLRHQGGYADPTAYPRPSIILMDIRLPGIDGVECLQAIRADPALRTIPVIMFTTSNEERDARYVNYQHLSLSRSET